MVIFHSQLSERLALPGKLTKRFILLHLLDCDIKKGQALYCENHNSEGSIQTPPEPRSVANRELHPLSIFHKRNDFQC